MIQKSLSAHIKISQIYHSVENLTGNTISKNIISALLTSKYRYDMLFLLDNVYTRAKNDFLY